MGHFEVLTSDLGWLRKGASVGGLRIVIGVLFVVAVIVTLFTLISVVVSTITWIVEIAVVVALGFLVWHLFVRKR